MGFFCQTWYHSETYSCRYLVDPLDMVKQTRNQILFILLGLCMLAILPMYLPVMKVVGVSMLDFSQIDVEEVEFEEVFHTLFIAVTALSGLFFAGNRSRNLNLKVACIIPVSPPPKYR